MESGRNKAWMHWGFKEDKTRQQALSLVVSTYDLC